MNIILTICICGLDERLGQLSKLLHNLHFQSEGKPVQILTEVDNRKIPTGTKRNKMYNEAEGEYVCSIDDDDSIEPDYVDLILKALESKPDAVSINGIMTTNNRDLATWNISKDNDYVATRKHGRIHYLRFHNHLSPMKKSIAIQFPFPDIVFGEDYAFALAVHNSGLIQTETVIGKNIYHYKFKTRK